MELTVGLAARLWPKLLGGITAWQAVDVVRAEYIRRGWPWRYPVFVSGGVLAFRVWTGEMLDGSTVAVVRRTSGKVLRVVELGRRL